ncbi:MAG: hypothetical protein RSE54_04955 [Ruthenibacterium sp.]
MKKLFGTKKITAVLTVMALALTGAAPVAAAAPVSKDEVVYVNMDAGGKVDAIYVVNSFELTMPGTITDYGSYAELTDLTADAPAEKNGETVTLHAPAGKISYEGKLNQNGTPWDISVRYFLNGKGIAPQELGGKSGVLGITLQIRQNPSIDKTFFEHYTLQVTVTLDGTTCKNIIAPTATVANASSNKQLAFMVLPGTESTLEITADVTDFTMPAITVNGVAMNLSLDVDSLLQKGDGLSGIGDLGTAFSELTDGTKALLDGVGALKRGAGVLDDGALSLYGGAKELQNGVGTLYSGVGSINAGTAQLAGGLNALNANSASLVAGARQIVDQLFQQVNAQLKAQGIALPDLTLENYVTVLAGQATITDAMRSAAEQEFLAQLISGGVPPTSAADMLNLVAILANPILAAGAPSKDAIAQAMGMIGLVDGARNALAAASGDALQIPAVQTILGGMAPAMGLTDAAGVYTALKAQLQGATPTLSDPECAQLITMACMSAAQGGAFDLAQAAQTANAVGQAATAAADPSALADNKLRFLNVLVTENLGGQLAALKTQLDGIAAFYNGLVQYTGGVGQLAGGAGALTAGVAQLQGGVGTLQGGVGTFANGLRDYEKGVAQYKNGVASVYGGMKQLDDGTAAFGDFEESGSNLLDGIMGGDFTPVSFTSPKNTAVNSVQFVMKTAAIEKAEATAELPPEETAPGFWQRLKNLFV